jgi:hypothetical protein
MTVANYLKKCKEICDTYDPQGCKGCPLKGNMSCGVPSALESQKKVVKIVAAFNAPPPPYICPQCKSGGHDPTAKFCNICGFKIPNAGGITNENH